MRQTLTSPSAEQITEAVAAAIRAANGWSPGSLVAAHHLAALRAVNDPIPESLVDPRDTDGWTKEVDSTAEGHLEADGGGGPNSYGMGAMAATVAIAWWTDGRGVKHVTVYGCRAPCHGRHVITALPGTRAEHHKAPAVMLVYGALMEVWWRQNNKGDERALIRTILARPNDAAPWLVYADWLQEHGVDELPDQIRAVFAAPAAR